MSIDLGDIQGNILRPYAMMEARLVFVHFDQAAAGREWLAGLVDQVTTSQPWADGQKPATLNLAFTSTGLQALGLDAGTLATFSQEFQDGMAAQADQLGDTGTNAPKTWEPRWRDRRVHAVVAVHAQTPAEVAERLGPVEAAMYRHGVTTEGEPQEARRIVTGGQVKEHFGFNDGFGQPALDIAGYPRPFRGQGTPDGKGAWNPVALGEFILGQPDEEGVLPAAPQPAELAANGTYVVYRKLHQHVGRYREYVAAQADRLHWMPERVGASLIGRWPDGSPLALTPDRPDGALGADEARNNDFLFDQGDANGHRCPIGSHIRRANPRDALKLSPQLTSRHRMIRRGITYGPVLAEGAPEDHEERGLHFMCCVANLRRQFEFVQAQWLNGGNIFHLGDDRDAMGGCHDGTRKMTVQGEPPRFLPAIPEFVTTRGGEYFFKPGVSAMRWLSQQG
jgi:Dyp-type peroxidase family